MKRSQGWLFIAGMLLAGAVASCRESGVVGARAEQSGGPNTAALVAAGQMVETRRVWERDLTGGSISPDGRLLLFVDGTGNLAVRDLSTGQNRVLTKNTGDWIDFANYTAVFSPDGTRVAYSWFADDHFTLRLIALAGGEPQTLLDNATKNIEVHHWSPDGLELLTVIEGQSPSSRLATVRIADRSVRTLKTFDTHAPLAAAYSPDGRFIAFDLPPDVASVNRDVFVMATDGRREAPLVRHAANDQFLGWAPGGAMVLFSSDRRGTPGVFAQTVSDGRAAGVPTLVKADMWKLAGPVGFDRAGRFFYRVQPEAAQIFTATVDLKAGRFTIPPASVGAAVAALRGIAWSPDGKYLSWVEDRPPSAKRNVVVMRSLETGERRELVTRMTQIGDLAWFPDGQALRARGEDERRRPGLYRVDVRSGSASLITVESGVTFAADGRTELVLTRGTGSTGDTLLLRRDGRSRELYRGAARVGPAVPSPDGTLVAFVEYEPRPTRISVVSTEGGQPRKLYEDATIGTASLQWGTDGRLMFFLQGETTQVVSVDSRTGDAVKFDAGMKTRFPRLAPDGQRLAFVGGTNRYETWVMDGLASSAR